MSEVEGHRVVLVNRDLLADRDLIYEWHDKPVLSKLNLRKLFIGPLGHITCCLTLMMSLMTNLDLHGFFSRALVLLEHIQKLDPCERKTPGSLSVLHHFTALYGGKMGCGNCTEAHGGHVVYSSVTKY